MHKSLETIPSIPFWLVSSALSDSSLSQVRLFITNEFIASLRVQLSDPSFKDFSNKKAIGEFIIGSFLLYLSCLCLVG